MPTSSNPSTPDLPFFLHYKAFPLPSLLLSLCQMLVMVADALAIQECPTKEHHLFVLIRWSSFPQTSVLQSRPVVIFTLNFLYSNYVL